MQLMPQMWLDMIQICNTEFLEMDFNISLSQESMFCSGFRQYFFIDPPSLECQLYMQSFLGLMRVPKFEVFDAQNFLDANLKFFRVKKSLLSNRRSSTYSVDVQ